LSDDAQTAAETAANAATDETSATQNPAEPAVFALEPGARVRYGPDTGRVLEVRGGGEEPYEVEIRWDGKKYPEWHLYRSLARRFRGGDFEVLKPGRRSILRRICPFCR